jgi:hypothetical protein
MRLVLHGSCRRTGGYWAETREDFQPAVSESDRAAARLRHGVAQSARLNLSPEIRRAPENRRTVILVNAR